MRQFIDLQKSVEFHDARDVAGFEFWDGIVKGLLEAVVDSLRYQSVEVDRPTKKLNVALPQQGQVTVGWGAVGIEACFQTPPFKIRKLRILQNSPQGFDGIYCCKD